MALSAQLGTMNFTPQSLRATATVTLEKLDAGWTVSKVHLDLAAKIPGISEADFDKASQGAKANCPISRLLKAEITLSSHLEQAA
jgi:osmotically inducible protein OsmC